MDTITSLQNPRVKLAHGLQTRPRTRRKERKIVLEGMRLVRDALERGHQPEFVLYEAKTVDYIFLAEMQTRQIDLTPINEEILQHLSDTEHPQGLIAVFPLPVPKMPRQLQRVLILDNLRDPGNVGGILRTAAAAGVDVAVLSPGCADPYNPKALRSGMGAHFRIPVVESEWADIAEFCQRLNVYWADAEGDITHDAVDWTQAWALVIGSEAHGISEAAKVLGTSDTSDGQSERQNGRAVSIPMSAATESLNANVAAAVILFEAQRQLRQAKAGRLSSA